MKLQLQIVLSCFLTWSSCVYGIALNVSQCRVFPENFIFAVATAAYQVEGAWNEGGKTESIWDRMVHSNKTAIADGSTGDVACDSYRLWRRDIEIMRELGVDMYRFSVSWPRLLPNGFTDYINQEAVDYYNAIIDEAIAHNIKPAITIYHWDLPQKFQDLGGWTNPIIIDYFLDYADVVFRLFGDKVKIWITINEPKQICIFAYSMAIAAPQIQMSGVADYLCAKNVLLAHAKAWHLYNNKYRSKQNGICGIVVHTQFYYNATDDVQDIQAMEHAEAFEQGLYLHPIFSKEGDYPKIMKERIAQRSKEEGFPRSRLPELNAEEIALLKGSSDFVGVNSYASYLVRPTTNSSHYAIPSYENDMNVELDIWPEDMKLDNYWAYTQLFLKIKKDYNNPPVFIMENGYGDDISDTGMKTWDEKRAVFYRRSIAAVLDAIDAGCDIRSYTAWSLMDNFEWWNGYKVRFGMYQVDFNNPDRPRTPKLSAYIFSDIVRNRCLRENQWPLSYK